jgi:hypothetical protein
VGVSTGVERADRYWSRDFACAPHELRLTGTHVQEHAGILLGATGIWILAVGAFPRVSMPPAAMPILGSGARQWLKALVSNPAALAAELAPLTVEKIVGPAFIGYGYASTLKLESAGLARRLTTADSNAITGLRGECSLEEWEHGGSKHADAPTFGAFDAQGTLCALASYSVWPEQIAHISIVTAATRRGRGFATSAVACAARHALEAGLLPQYRTLAANVPSLGVAQRLGFVEYGFSIYVRLATG